jgi:hypothetical protein
LQKTWLCAAKFKFGLAHRTVRWCTGQCPVRQAGPCELAALGIRRRRTAKNHWTIRWCTGLSGESSAANSSLSGKASGRRGYNSPDYPVSQRSPALTIGRKICERRVAAPTVGRGHRTVWCAPDSVRCANGPGAATVDCARFGRQSRTGQATVAVRWRTGLSGAPLDRRQGWPSKFASNGS